MEGQEKTAPVKRMAATRDFVGSIMRGDKPIWSLYITLFCISAVEIFSATSQLAYKSDYVSDPAFSHIKYLFFGLIFVLIAQSMSLKSMQAWGKILWLGAVALALITPFFGVEQKGATRSLGGIQPVELCKVGVIMALCSAVAARDASYHFVAWFRTHTQLRRFWFYLFLIGAAVIPIALQNLSSGIIVSLASFGVLFLGRVNGKYLWQTLLIALVGGLLFLWSLRIVYDQNRAVSGLENIEVAEEQPRSQTSIDKVITRYSTWANRVFGGSDVPLWEEDINGKKSQEIYSHMALVNGYPIPRFFGNSKMRDFLPEAFSDYIFAIIFEETGIFGALFILILYLSLLGRCIWLSFQTRDPYIRLLIVGLPLVIIIQALIHIGVCTGAMFVTGQPLPLISRGGSSIVCTSFSFGLILALSRLIKQEQDEAAAPSEPESEPEALPAEGETVTLTPNTSLNA